LPSIDGSPMALGSTGAHEVWVKQVNPHQGPTPLTVFPLARKRWELTSRSSNLPYRLKLHNLKGVRLKVDRVNY
jgi:hypothetical protein